ncbi:hypothetical protein EHF33_00245 [Deinococcus psychrotolerans]|uniref:Uncharacterized protein n=1 Tax=Deinococcus psychrotolerans TaxID=2489213 RepID=A0A3G8Y8Y9_9DEIO|nr:hypothetical protein [Deinococcus psychrotolerans]AZI41373.1 hypothetical protein EHF33_00245 [Deinococcus psychrotolerans]
MRPAYLSAARSLQLGREAAIESDSKAALELLSEALGTLRVLPPERTRDVLLSHVHLAFFQTLAIIGADAADEHLHLGVSYARSTRDPLARAIAQECLSGMEAVL